MSQAKIYDLGPCEVVFNGTSLGKTHGDVVFKYNIESRDIKEDQAGVTPVDAVLVGGVCECTVPMTRSTLAQLAAAIPGASLTTANLLESNNPVGVSRYDLAGSLVLKPIVNNAATTDQTRWLTIHKAHPSPNFEVVFNNEGQRVFNVMFKAFPNQSTPIGSIWRMGAV